MLRAIVTISLVLAVAFTAPLDESIFDEEVIQVEDVTTTIPQGQLLGKKESLGLTNSYYSFKGIPYAEAPVGSLRFRAPRPHRGWSGTWDATSHRSECLQSSTIGSHAGSEDCLFLNVYTPSMTGRKAVMVFIHGGSFTGGSGNTFYYGPENLMREDVVLVTINYRLNVLGFFSTGDRHAQGNYGLKDCVEALHWVQDNIQYFGGDRNSITIFGESAGSVMVNYLVLSTAARGMYHKAIMQSGVALVPWGYNPEPRNTAFDIARRLNLQATTTEGIVSELRAMDSVALVKAIEGWLDLPLPRGHWAFESAPVVEVDWVEPPFLTQAPMDILKAGTWNQVPVIIGANSHESLFVVRELLIDPNIFAKYENNPHWLIPTSWPVVETSPAAAEIVTALQDVYFHGESVKEKIDYVDYASDTHFHYPVYKTVKMMAARKLAPVYYYIFEYVSVLNFPKHLLLLDGYPGAMHADELGYLFRMGGFPAPVVPGSKTDHVRSRMCSMWANFAKTGNPTPTTTSLITALWEQVDSNQEFMWIKSELEPGTQPMYNRMSVWDELDSKYGP